jgi:hypothetical protein
MRVFSNQLINPISLSLYRLFLLLAVITVFEFERTETCIEYLWYYQIGYICILFCKYYTQNVPSSIYDKKAQRLSTHDTLEPTSRVEKGTFEFHNQRRWQSRQNHSIGAWRRAREKKALIKLFIFHTFRGETIKYWKKPLFLAQQGLIFFPNDYFYLNIIFDTLWKNH